MLIFYFKAQEKGETRFYRTFNENHKNPGFFVSEDNNSWKKINLKLKDHGYEAVLYQAELTANSYTELKVMAKGTDMVLTHWPILSPELDSKETSSEEFVLSQISFEELPLSLQELDRETYSLSQKFPPITTSKSKPHEKFLTSSSCLTIDMTTVGFFMEILGGLAVALAFTFLSGVTFGVVAGLGAVFALTGFGFFAWGACRDDHINSSKPDSGLGSPSVKY
ncbi:MAG: hypothetical protein H0U73_11240 [Tatlockia sp.]|nr:hypothetical protein [Tatlockia sp.]